MAREKGNGTTNTKINIMNNSSVSACYSCGKALSDPVSVELGIGPVCRVKNKMDEFWEKTRNMFANRSEYDWGITSHGDILYITDEGGLKSVTNDMENVLADISEHVVLDELQDLKIIYRDSMGIWDGVNISFGENHSIKGISFYPVTEKNFGRACEKVMSMDLISK